MRPLPRNTHTHIEKKKSVYRASLESGVCVQSTLHVRVVDVEQPVEAHVHTQRDVDQMGVALLQSLIQAGQAGDQLRDVQELLVLFQTVLVKHLARQRHAQQVHWGDEERGYRCSIGSSNRGAIRDRIANKVKCYVIYIHYSSLSAIYSHQRRENVSSLMEKVSGTKRTFQNLS